MKKELFLGLVFLSIIIAAFFINIDERKRVKSMERIYFDTTWTSTANGNLSRFIERIEKEKTVKTVFMVPINEPPRLDTNVSQERIRVIFKKK